MPTSCRGCWCSGCWRASLERGEVIGEVVVVPVANPIGLAQQVQGYLRGRYEDNSAGNFNRGYADLAEAVAPVLEGRLGPDASGERRGGAGGDGRSAGGDDAAGRDRGAAACAAIAGA